MVDSTVDLTEELYETYNFVKLPLYVTIDGKTYRDTPEELSNKKLFEIMEETKTLPKTSAATPADFLEEFKKAEKNGYEAIIITGISSTLSGTIQSATIAIEMYKGPLDIRIVDSLNLSTGSGLIAIFGSDYAKTDHNLDEVVAYMESLVPRVRTQFIVESLDIIYRGGRISSAKYLLGKIFNAHPFIQVINGKLEVTATPKGKLMRALNHQYSVFKKDFKKGILNDHVFITHAVAEESVRYYCKKMKDKLPHGALKVTETGSVISAHCGPGTIGITYIVKSKL
ncbi:MAG: DegV family protein [Bacillota bacterium]|nr:DegV family protein [Bacillota bacterium]